MNERIVKNKKDFVEIDECEDIEDIKNFLAHFRTPTLSDEGPTVGIVGSGGVTCVRKLAPLQRGWVLWQKEGLGVH